MITQPLIGGTLGTAHLFLASLRPSPYHLSKPWCSADLETSPGVLTVIPQLAEIGPRDLAVPDPLADPQALRPSPCPGWCSVGAHRPRGGGVLRLWAGEACRMKTSESESGTGEGFRSGEVENWGSCRDVRLWQEVWGRARPSRAGSLTSFLPLSTWFQGCFVIDEDLKDPESPPAPQLPERPQLRCQSWELGTVVVVRALTGTFKFHS